MGNLEQLEAEIITEVLIVPVRLEQKLLAIGDEQFPHALTPSRLAVALHTIKYPDTIIDADIFRSREPQVRSMRQLYNAAQEFNQFFTAVSGQPDNPWKIHFDGNREVARSTGEVSVKNMYGVSLLTKPQSDIAPIPFSARPADNAAPGEKSLGGSIRTVAQQPERAAQAHVFLRELSELSESNRSKFGWLFSRTASPMMRNVFYELIQNPNRPMGAEQLTLFVAKRLGVEIADIRNDIIHAMAELVHSTKRSFAGSAVSPHLSLNKTDLTLTWRPQIAARQPSWERVYNARPQAELSNVAAEGKHE